MRMPWTSPGSGKQLTNGAGPPSKSNGSRLHAVQAPTPAHIQEPKFFDSDPERGVKLDNHFPTRATLPNTQANRSQTSLQLPPDTTYSSGLQQGGQDGAAVAAEDYAWGPMHPCFPHPNPHVPYSSPLYSSTRIIRVKRDWMIAGDLAPTFSNLYPEILDPLLPEDQFRAIVGKLNDELVAIFSPWRLRNWLDAVMGVLTFWVWEDLGLTDVKRRLAALEAWLEEWNREVGAKEGVSIIPLRRTAYMTLDIQIPDPHVGLDVSEPEPEPEPDADMHQQAQSPSEADALRLPIMNGNLP